MNYRNIINKGASILRNNAISTAHLDAEILLSKSLNKTREEIILNLEEKLNAHQINYYYKLINRRKKKEPISLITKKKYFWKFLIGNSRGDEDGKWPRVLEKCPESFVRFHGKLPTEQHFSIFFSFLFERH